VLERDAKGMDRSMSHALAASLFLLP
jgi:hypothetical protein